MKMTLTCTGGFAGPAGAQTRTVDLAQLPPDQAAQFAALLHATDFFALPDQLAKPAPQSWDFRYDLEVAEGGHTHTVRYYLDAAPEQLKALTETISTQIAPDSTA